MSGGKVRAKLSALLELANAGPLFQGVQCQAVFMELQHVSHERFEDTIDSLRACSPEASSAYHCDMKRLYYRLLDGGFLDNYLHLHYDVNLHTSYATVVSIAKVDAVWASSYVDRDKENSSGYDQTCRQV